MARRRILGVCLGTLLVAGCGTTRDTAPVDHATTRVAKAAAPAVPADPPPPDAAQPPKPRSARFDPPFPHRSQLFEPPRGGQPTDRSHREQVGTIELKGFVHVESPQVVLVIDGVLSPIAEGGERYGVQVISIEPPSVVLQRGRSRWTASLE